MGVQFLRYSFLTKRQIGQQVPGRSAASMQVSYNRLKSMVETFSTADVRLI